MSRCSAICGDDSCMAPIFCGHARHCVSCDRHLLGERHLGAAERHRVAELHAASSPGANGPFTVTRLTARDGVLAVRPLEQPGADGLGRQSRTRAAARIFTGRCAVLTIWRMLKTFSASSPISITKRLCSPSTTVPAIGGAGCEVGARLLLLRHRGVGRDQHRRMPPADGTSNSCDSSRSPSTVVAAFTACRASGR